MCFTHLYRLSMDPYWGQEIDWERSSHQSSIQVVEKNKVDVVRFAPFWNEIIRNLREEDYLTNLNSGDLPLVQWPLFLLASKESHYLETLALNAAASLVVTSFTLP
ncbi:hypothetical protein GLYMA_06G265440v4 [Glycine max]|nr:hypothetical protein GLYMA_06G265440v4 [Glycine max]KAH1127775.1 hypothetical protein GYH30_016370 [Glycine max]